MGAAAPNEPLCAVAILSSSGVGPGRDPVQLQLWLLPADQQGTRAAMQNFEGLLWTQTRHYDDVGINTSVILFEKPVPTMNRTYFCPHISQRCYLLLDVV